MVNNLYTIGYQGPLTGDKSQYGKDQLAGVKLAVNNVNASGLLPFELQLLEIDDKGDSKISLSAANNAIGTTPKLLGVVGLPFSEEAKKCVIVYSKKNIPCITPSLKDQTLTFYNFF
jgi:branched-chain amino acid transport system substrate-binding protein